MLRVKLIKREVGDFQGEHDVPVKVIEIYSRAKLFLQYRVVKYRWMRAQFQLSVIRILQFVDAFHE